MNSKISSIISIKTVVNQCINHRIDQRKPYLKDWNEKAWKSLKNLERKRENTCVCVWGVHGQEMAAKGGDFLFIPRSKPRSN